MTSTTRALAGATAALTAALSALALAAPAAAATEPASGITCDATTCRYVFPDDVGTPMTFWVPEGVTEITADLVGSAGAPRGRHEGGPGGALRTTVPVTPGEAITVQVPRWRSSDALQIKAGARGETIAHRGGELAAIYRGAGPESMTLAIAGGGGAAGTAGPGGAGGGWDPDPARVLHGQDAPQLTGGRGATPSAPGRAPSGFVLHAGEPGSGPALGVGGRGVGGWAKPLQVRGGRSIAGADGGMGFYGGGSGSWTKGGEQVGGGGGGAGYLQPGLTALPVPALVAAAGYGHGLVALEWAAPPVPLVFEPVLLDADGHHVTGELGSRSVVVGASGLPEGARVAVSLQPAADTTVWGDVAADGTLRVPYTLPYAEYADEVWLAAELFVDGESEAAVRLDLDLPVLETVTELEIPEQVAAGAQLELGLARTGTQFGAATPGLTPAEVVDLLRNGHVQVLLDGELVEPGALTLPDRLDVPSSGYARFSLTAPTAPGEHTLTILGTPENYGHWFVDTIEAPFEVLAAAEPEPTATPAVVVASPAATAAPSAVPTATPTERAEVLAAGSSPRGGALAATGAKVTGVVVLALALVGTGVLVLRARGARGVRPRHSR